MPVDNMAWGYHVCKIFFLAKQAHLAPVMSVEEVQAVLATLLTNNKIQRATHNIMAYRIHIPDRSTLLQAWPLLLGVGYHVFPCTLARPNPLHARQGGGICQEAGRFCTRCIDRAASYSRDPVLSWHEWY